MAIRWCRWLKVSVGWSVGVFVRVGEDGGVRFFIDQHSLIVLGWFPRVRARTLPGELGWQQGKFGVCVWVGGCVRGDAGVRW